MKFDVVIAGGGFAGAYCARELGAKWGPIEGPKRVALIAERNVLVFYPMLAEVAGSTLGPLDVVHPLHHFCRDVTVLQGAVQRIDWPKRELLVDGGRFTRDQTIQCDKLVVALGSVTNLSQIPGMSEHGWPMKNVADALRFRSALINRLEEANLTPDPAVRARLLTFVVVGGGYTGVETTGQLLGFLRSALRWYPSLQGAPLRVVLIHSGNELLPEIGPNLGAYAREVLERRGIDVRLNCRVESLTMNRVNFTGGYVETHTVLTTIGNAPNPVVSELGRELKLEMPHGRIAVDGTMQVPNIPGLYSVGDCAAVPWNDRGTPKTCPPTAQFALRQGRQLAQNLLRERKGAPARPFTYRYLGQLATIGNHEAVAEVLGLHFRGFVAWWLWRTIYLAKLPGVFRRLRVMLDWTFDLIFARDISVVLPPPDEVMRSIHLEKGERLFAEGAVARAVFFVRRGAIDLAGGNARQVGPGELIDQDDANSAGCWTCTAVASEPSDLIVLRGRAYQLIKDELKIVPRKAAPPAPEKKKG
ncbi:MAG TPA: FAD-dependent oxidoreductase [Opitutaceae bacterium]|jgi:NADH dehydrogenase